MLAFREALLSKVFSLGRSKRKSVPSFLSIRAVPGTWSLDLLPLFNTSSYSSRQRAVVLKANKIDDECCLLQIYKLCVVTYGVKRITVKETLSNSPRATC